MRQRHTNLWLIALTPEQHSKTCGYWYLVHSNHASYKAFASRSCLYRWLDERGLSIDDSRLAPHGEYSIQQIQGCFAEEWSLSQAEFDALPNVILETRQCDNAQYTLAKITRNADGMRTVHLLNCNVKTRVVFPYFESDALHNGRVTLEDSPQLDANYKAMGGRQ